MKSKKSKLLHKALDRPIIDWALEQATAFGHSAVVVVGHQKDEIEKRISQFAPPKMEIRFAHQKEPRGTADAVKVALHSLESEDPETKIFIMGADCVLLKKETLQYFSKDFDERKAILSMMTTRLACPGAYGRMVRDAQGSLSRIVEAKEATPAELEINEINVGFYLMRLGHLRDAMSQIKNQNRTKEFYLTDLVVIARSKGWLLTTQEIPSEEAFGLNTQEELTQVDAVLKQRLNSYWMQNGVTLIEPSSIRIGADVVLSSDVTLEPGVQLKGKTKIAAGVRVGSHSILEDVTLGENVQIEAFSHLKGAEVAANCSIGPFARIRPGALLDEEVHIGNFVEVKKSHLGKGVKAGHLTYLGDANIGAETNIGAGTITCNYDGFGKFETRIGKKVFIGSNTALVAPVKVGDGAIVGAGSVITKDVSKDALALERSEQIEKRGRAKIFRENRKKD